MIRTGMRFLCCCLLLLSLQQVFIAPVRAGEDKERIQLLQAKMAKLQELLGKVQEEKLREQAPIEIPWQPILQSGEEWSGYYQYAYLLAPQMAAENIDSILQQLNYIASQDEMKQRGGLFVVPTLPLDAGEQMTVKNYNRDFAGALLKTIKVPTSISGGMVIAPTPLTGDGGASETLLFIDLTGCDQVLRSRIFGLLQSYRMFADDGSIHGYVWELLQSAAPQAFTVYMQGKLMWLKLAD